MKLFAYETSWFSGNCDLNVSSIDVSKDLKSIKASVNQWKMSSNPDRLKQAHKSYFNGRDISYKIYSHKHHHSQIFSTAL